MTVFSPTSSFCILTIFQVPFFVPIFNFTLIRGLPQIFTHPVLSSYNEEWDTERLDTWWSWLGLSTWIYWAILCLICWAGQEKTLPVSCLEGTLLAARVWVAEWGKKARGLNIAYKVLALFLLSVCSQNRNPPLPLLRIDLHFSTSWGESLESDCFLNRFSNNFPVFKPPHPPNFQKYLGQPIPGPFGGFTCKLGCSSTFFIACLGVSQLPFFVG